MRIFEQLRRWYHGEGPYKRPMIYIGSKGERCLSYVPLVMPYDPSDHILPTLGEERVLAALYDHYDGFWTQRWTASKAGDVYSRLFGEVKRVQDFVAIYSWEDDWKLPGTEEELVADMMSAVYKGTPRLATLWHEGIKEECVSISYYLYLHESALQGIENAMPGLCEHPDDPGTVPITNLNLIEPKSFIPQILKNSIR